MFLDEVTDAFESLHHSATPAGVNNALDCVLRRWGLPVFESGVKMLARHPAVQTLYEIRYTRSRHKRADRLQFADYLLPVDMMQTAPGCGAAGRKKMQDSGRDCR